MGEEVQAVKGEPGREGRCIVEVLAGLTEWVCGSRRAPATAVCIRAESLGHHGGTWKVTLNTAGDAFSLADLRCDALWAFFFCLPCEMTGVWRMERWWAG